jgi:SAM-dependent methyltransferase
MIAEARYARRMNTPFSDPRSTWDARFARDDYIFGTAPNVFLTQQAPRLHPGQRALCVADGEGRNSVWLAQQGLAVTAFDISPRGVDKARALAQRHGVAVDYAVADVDGFAWTPAAFDVVVAIFIQFAPPVQRSRLFAQMIEALLPGGLLLLQGYTPRQIDYATGGPGRADHLYTPELLREAFGAHEIVELREHDNVLAEGTQHAGMSALIDCVVRRR